MTDREHAPWRRETRRALLSARAALPTDEREQKSKEALENLQARWTGLTLRAARPITVAAYLPMQGEIDPQPFLDWLTTQRAELALPAVPGSGRPLEFRAWRPGEALAEGPFGTRHPASGKPVQPTALLIPVVGFDEGNYRLGYGGGYYDRTLAALDPKPLTIGLGFELSRIPTIYPQPHDIPLDFIATELA